MDQTQYRALTALQPFIHLAITTVNPSPRFLADIVTRATSAPNTFVFAELRQIPAIQSLRSTEYTSHLTQLEMFAWGTWEEYHSTPNLPQLTEPQAEKLRQLSLLSLASSLESLTYSSLITSLGLTNGPQLESLVTSAIYASLLTARLSPATNPPLVHITSVSPLRDLRPNSLPAMLKILERWESRCTSVVSDIESQITAIRADAVKRQAKENSRREVVEKAVLEEADPKKGTRSKGDNKAQSPDEMKKGRGFASGNKRVSDDNEDEDDYVDEKDAGNKMDLDDGPGVGKGVGGGAGTGGMGRNVKRALGMGKKGS